VATFTLALDLGTTTGWCMGCDVDTSVSGRWVLNEDRTSGAGMRFYKLRQELHALHGKFGLARVVFEDVRAHKGVYAAQVYGAFQGALMTWCEQHGVPYEGIGVGTIKKFWTGKGNASKQQMIDKCADLDMAVTDDNEADAIALFHFIMHRDAEKGEEIASVKPRVQSASGYAV
jgi:crossover junction endodeoxyribonuclease RuvC